jgi:carbon storage regulator CsrA
MLVLSRRLGEAILIADNIRVKVISIRGCHVGLGIEAPRSVEVNREEVAARRGAGADSSPDGSGPSHPLPQVAGKETVAPPAAEHVQVLHLMDALKKSVAEAQADQKPEARPPKKLASSGRGEGPGRKRKSS